MKTYDVLIIGAGPAGLTSGLYSARNGMSVLIVSKNIGGTANIISNLDNWPGFKGSGKEFIDKFEEQLKQYDIDFTEEEAISILKNGEEFTTKTKEGEIKSKSIIITTGMERKKLKIPGEEEFLGKGVSYCATCDAFFFKDKTIAVLGKNNCDIESVLLLSDIANKVYFICLDKETECKGDEKERLEKTNNVEIFYNSKPKSILGKEKVEEIEFEIEGENQKLKIDGVFIEMGSTPLAEITKSLGIKMDDQKFIEVDANMNTSVKGIYAAGDVTNQKLKQVVVASAQGAIASKSAYNWINKE